MIRSRIVIQCSNKLLRIFKQTIHFPVSRNEMALTAGKFCGLFHGCFLLHA